MNLRKFSLIVAANVPDYGIGFNGTIPWKVPEDLKFFKQATTTTKDSTKQNAVIMGRKTWESIPSKYKPLPQRLNIVLTRNINSDIAKNISSISNTFVSSSFENAIEKLSWKPYLDNIETIYVIGGSEIYNLCINKYNNLLDSIYLTKINNDNIKCDTYFKIDIPSYDCIDLSDKLICKTNPHITYQFIQLLPKKKAVAVDKKEEEEVDDTHEEYQYINLIKDILSRGVRRGDRTGTGTLSIFGAQMKYNLRNNIMPLLTTKRVFWRGLAEELLWFMNGETNANLLKDKRIHIWDGNSSREFLDKRGLTHHEVGDLGPVYGFQWRHFGAEYRGMNYNYSGLGVDQLINCINQIKSNPNSRRIVMSAWNPSDLPKMALPPCHMFVQFYVANGELSSQMYQRSADMGLGVPFNIASYALLTKIIAQICELKTGDFVHTIGDAHVYLNHIEPLKEQLKRKPKKFPILKINPNKMKIEDFKYEDFKISGYKPHKSIKMKMAV